MSCHSISFINIDKRLLIIMATARHPHLISPLLPLSEGVGGGKRFSPAPGGRG